MSSQQELEEIRKALAEIRELVLKPSPTLLEPKLVSAKQASVLLGVSLKHVRRMIARGSLMTVDVDGPARIPMAEITRYTKPKIATSNQGDETTERRVAFDGAKALAKLKELDAQNARASKAKKPKA